MTTDVNSALFVCGEGPTVEFKRSLTKDVGRELCAFANADGGTILIGVSDTGEIIGVANHNRLKSRLQNTARSADPPIELEVESVDRVLRVVVPPQKRKPYSFGGRFFMRIGANGQQMSNAEVEDLFYAVGRLHFDGKPCVDFSMENDLDDEAWARFCDRAKVPDAMDRMVALRNLHLLDGEDRMTHAGAWLLARDIRRFTTTAHVSCALFMGTEKVRILDRRDFHRDIPAMIDDAVAWVLTKINVEFIIEHVRREERPELPEEALREAVANAVAHRDYRSTANVHIYVFRNRIEIISPGGLPAGMTEADLGVKSMHELCREYGVAKPTIDVSEHWVTVMFPRPVGQVEPERMADAGTGGNRITNAIGGTLEAKARSEGESRPESGPDSRPESRPESGPESLELRVLTLLVERPLSRSAIADCLGHQSVSAGLKRVIRNLLNVGRIAYTIPDKPNSRLQRYRITPAGRSALEDPAK